MAKKKTPQKKVLHLKNAELSVLKLKDYGMCMHLDGCDEDCDGKKKSNKKCSDYKSIQPYIPELAPHYSADLDAAETIAFGISNNENILIVGPPGCGKTTLVQVICAVSQREMVSFSAHEESRYSHLVGQWTVVGDSMKWSDGYVTDAMRHGKVLLENESDFMRPELRGGMHGILDNHGSLTLQTHHAKSGEPFLEVIPRHKNFRWISTANTIGLGDDSFRFHGTQLQNAASRDRYNIIIKMDYLNKEKEANVLTKRTGIDEETALKMSEVAWGIRNLVRSNSADISYDFTMRRLLAWADYHQRKAIPQDGLKLAILNFAKEDPTEINTILNVVRTEFGQDFVAGLEV